MKIIRQPKQRFTRLFSVALTALMLFGLAPAPKGQDAKTNSPASASNGSAGQTPATATNKQPTGSTNSASAAAAVKQAKPVVKELTGAELYSMHCARCHPERYPSERTAAQWKTVALHMRVRANLPADHFRKVLKYLQDNSGY